MIPRRKEAVTVLAGIAASFAGWLSSKVEQPEKERS
jgi:hypothetical protein